MEWYLPITILPGLGMLILSTTGQTMALSQELGVLLADKCTDFNHMIADRKIKQLGRLTRATVLLYSAAGCYVLSGILSLASKFNALSNIILYIGTLMVFIALVFLIVYAFRGVDIRKSQFDHNHLL